MVKTALDATDRKILRYLIKNARTPFLEIARECGISGAAIHQRIKKLEDMGVIQGSRLVVAPKSLGFDVCAFISIRVSDITQQQDTVERLKEIPEIVECHYITGSYNLMVKIYCIDNEHLMRTIFDKILHVQGVSSTQTYMSLNESFQREIHVDCLDY
jgi:Lrp/AsnC family transcriptional regulator for asnA, asnC and gidA